MALAIFRAATSVFVEEFPSLPVKLIEHGVHDGWSIIEILDRYPGPHFSEKRVALIRETAFAWACDPQIDPRQAFRHVWRCYRLLRSRKSPLGIQISRAMVKAGITRPIQVSRRLSKTQVKFIMSIVREVEGVDRAEKLDKLVFDYWTRVKSIHPYRRGASNTLRPRRVPSGKRLQFIAPRFLHSEAFGGDRRLLPARGYGPHRKPILRRLLSRREAGVVAGSTLDTETSQTLLERQIEETLRHTKM